MRIRALSNQPINTFVLEYSSYIGKIGRRVLSHVTWLTFAETATLQTHYNLMTPSTINLTANAASHSMALPFHTLAWIPVLFCYAALKGGLPL
jgi:hypothetical protein